MVGDTRAGCPRSGLLTFFVCVFCTRAGCPRSGGVGGLRCGLYEGRMPSPRGCARFGLLVFFCKGRGWRRGVVCEFALLWVLKNVEPAVD